MFLNYVCRIKSNQPQCIINYTDYMSEDTISKQEFVSIRREQKLDSLIDDKKYDESKLPKYSDDSIGTIGIKIIQKNVSLKAHMGDVSNADKRKFTMWVQELEKIALISSKNTQKSGQNLDIIKCSDILLTNSENIENFAKKIISRTISARNYIATNGRIGPGNVAFIGINVLPHLLESRVFMSNMTMNSGDNRKILGNFNGTEFIVCHDIDPNTILVFRSPSKQSVNEPTLMLVEADWDDNRWEVVDCGRGYCISFTVS